MRIDPLVIRRLAIEFELSWRAKLWPHVSVQVRAALVDAYVLQQIEIAATTRSVTAMTPNEIVKFRDAVRDGIAQRMERAYE